jgi:WD40 repeat protein
MKYWAFISYSHTDKEWGDWLHKALETYTVPRRLVGKPSREGTVPNRIYPIFRDREELPVAADLSANINEALGESRYLIVICSPRSAQSQWVAAEIKLFKKLKREDRVLALIVAGEPNARDGKPGFKPEEECFPEPIRYRVGEDGELTSVRTEPIAADAREGKDGRENAKLKLLAGLLGVNYDELRQRDHERRLRRARLIGATALVLMGIFAGLASWAIIAANQAATQKRQTQRLFVASDMARADELFAKDDAAGAICFLARATEQEPGDYSVAAERLWFALTERSWALPISAPMHHDDAVLSASFSPDGKKIVTASRDSKARIWDANSGATPSLVLPHPRLVRRALFTSDGRHVFTICFDGIGRLWDAPSGQAVAHWRIEHADSINSAALSPSGKLIATGSNDGVVRISDAATAQPVGEPLHHDENVHTLIFHPADETLLLSVSGPVAKLWKLPEGAALFEMRHDAQINSAQFDPRGNRIVTASSDRTVRLWDIATGKLIGEEIKHDGEVSNAVVSADGKLMASLVGSRLLLWDMGDKPKLRFTFEHGQRVSCARFSPDGLVIISGTDGGRVQGRNVNTGETVGEAIREDGAVVAIDLNRDGTRVLVATATGNARVWELPPRRPLASRLVHDGPIEALALSADGRFLATGSADAKARLWNLSAEHSSARELPHGAALLSVAFSPDGKYVLTGSDTKARLWSASSGEIMGEPLVHSATVSKVAFAPDGNSFVTATEDGTAQLWDLARRPIGKPMSHGGRLTALEFGADGKKLFTAGADGKIRLWQAKTGEAIGVVLQTEKEITCAHYSPNSELIAAGGRDGIVHVWSAASGKPVHQLAQKAAITACAFSPDGRFLAGGSEDQTVAIWEMASGKFVGDLLRHTAAVSAVVFSHDSRKIATASEDGAVCLWHVVTGRAITESLDHEKAVRCLAFSKDDRSLFSGSRDRDVKVWDIATDLGPADRDWIAAFARALSPSRLAGSGRMESRVIEPRESLRADNAPPAATAQRALLDWFFAERVPRHLTPYSSQTLAHYLTERAQEKSKTSADEALFFSSK